MVHLVRIGAGAMALICVAGGVAQADPLPIADVRQAVNTEDGWRLGVSLTQMTVNSVPNMAATAFTRFGSTRHGDELD